MLKVSAKSPRKGCLKSVEHITFVFSDHPISPVAVYEQGLSGITPGPLQQEWQQHYITQCSTGWGDLIALSKHLLSALAIFSKG